MANQDAQHQGYGRNDDEHFGVTEPKVLAVVVEVQMWGHNSLYIFDPNAIANQCFVEVLVQRRVEVGTMKIGPVGCAMSQPKMANGGRAHGRPGAGVTSVGWRRLTSVMRQTWTETRQVWILLAHCAHISASEHVFV